MPNEIVSTIQPLRASPAAGVRKPRVAIFCPARFAPDRPFLIVLFFHGYESLCVSGHRRPFEEALRRHALARQLADSMLNAIVVAPRVALSAREHRRGAPFVTWRGIEGCLREAGVVARSLVGAPSRFTTAFARAPLLLTGFSGGHHALSALAAHPRLMARTKAIAFFDALYDDDLYARDPAGLLERTALICINRRGYDRFNGPKEANYRKRLADAGVTPRRLKGVRSIERGMAIIERIGVPDHCMMVADGDCLLRVMAGIEGFRLLKPHTAAG